MFKNPLSLKGRIRRSEYVLSFFIYAVIAIVVTVSIFSGGSMLLLVAYPLLVWFALAQNAKRCHDLNKSGWYQLIPFYALWLLFANGTPGSNKYGANPKETALTAGAL